MLWNIWSSACQLGAPSGVGDVCSWKGWLGQLVRAAGGWRGAGETYAHEVLHLALGEALLELALLVAVKAHAAPALAWRAWS